jgi:4,5-dihydroxyphthalate decarboxylase
MTRGGLRVGRAPRTSVKLSLGCVDFFDRTSPLLSGRVALPGVELEAVPLEPTQLLGQLGVLDVLEVPLAPYVALRARDWHDDYVALPIFPFRGFQLGNTVVNISAGIDEPAELAGARIGCPGLFLSGTVWIRGVLREFFSVDEEEPIEWVVPTAPDASLAGRLSSAIRQDSGIRVTEAADAGAISAMLERGEIDAWAGSLPPASLEEGSPRVRRLFPDYREAERSYAAQAGFVPALHVVVARRATLERAPELVDELLAAFDEAKRIGAAQLLNGGLFACALPWIRSDLEELQALFGDDWYPYGYRANEEMLRSFARYAGEQGLVRKGADPREWFAPSSLDS